MKLSFKKLLLGALLCLLHIVAMAADVFQPGVVLVTYKKDATPEQVAAVEAKYSLTLKRRLAAFRISFYDCTAQPLPPDQLSKVLSTESSVSAASPDFGAKPQAADTRFGEQWYLQNTGQTVGDVVGTPGVDINFVRAKSIYAPKQSILVGVVDSGITLLHPDLVGSLHSKPIEVLNGIDDDGNGLIDDVTGFNWYDPANIKLPIDTGGHGTMVAGLIAATADNGKGIHGIAPTAKIVSHRVFSSLGKMGAPKYANISDVIFAVAASVDEGAKIINLSLGGGGFSAVEQQFYADLADEDVLIVASAGNGGSDGIGDNNDVTAHYPSSYGSAAIISVAAIDQKGALAEFSNYGLTSVDIAAPGTNILTTDVTRKTVHAPVFSVSNGGWKPYRLTATDFSYAQWGFYNGWMRDRIDGSQFYKAGTDTFLLSPRISLAGEYGAVVSFAGASSLADDFAWLESSSDGFNWETAYVFPKSGASSSLKADLADYDFGDLYLRFRIKSNSYNQSNGVLIKDLKVTSVDVLDEQNPSYTITAGTSFSAPIVSGVAAMVWMHRPELTAAQVKSIILDSARKLPALNGKVATGGIVDAEAALKLADVRTGNVLPVVIDQPDGGTYLQGASMTLSVFATSGLPATYQWRKDGVNISGATLSTYSINSLQVGDSGRYDVVVTSRAGAVVSASAQITVAARPPAIDSQPTRPALVMIAGENGYVMSVSATGTAPFAYQWLKAGVAIPGATSSSFTLNNLKTTDAGVYTVRVSNAAGSVTSQPVTVSVSVRPAFKTDLPATATVLTGVKRTLAVAATGSPLPTYQWRKDGVDIPNARLASYVVPATSVPTTATYSVVITNAAGSLESTLCQLSSVTIVSVPASGQPQARNVVAGQSASFTVTPAGTGPFTYQWLKSGVVIAGATSQTYTIPAVSALDAAAYSVRVSNGAGTATSLAATLSVLGFKTDLPATATVLTGATRTLAVAATGSPLPTYQWRKDGVDILNARLASYVVPATSVPTTATYSVVITNAAGSVESTLCQLSSVTIVSVPPSGQPQARNVKVGDSASFTVTPAGTGPFTYQWLKSGVVIAGATSQTYAIPAVSALDAAAYSVRVSNGAGTVTSLAATLSVLGFKTDLPATATVLTGATRTLAVAATGSPLPTYQWRKDGVDILNARLASYVVPATSVPTTATYSVVITNAAGSLESTLCQLSSVTIVSVPPSGQPQARNVKVGDSASFTVTPAGTGPFTYQWLKSGVVIAGATSQTYTIPAVSALDAAAYSVRVSNGAGTVTSLAATLSVLGFKTDLPATATVLTGATRTLAVAATGSPLPTYQWRKDGVDILNARLASYVVPATSVPTTATYSVVITNAAGSLESTLCQLSSVTIVSVPPSGQPQPRNVVAGQSANFTVTPAGTGPFTYQWLRNGVVIAGATSQTYSIAFVSALDAATYSVRVSNGGGTATSLGAILKVITPFNITGQPNAAVGTMVLAAGTSKALTVTVAGAGPFTYQWRKDGQPIAGATLASYLVQAGSVVGSAVYDVVITGPVSATSSSAVRVDTVLPPSFLQHPVSVARALGQPAAFSVSMAGTGPFTYQWLKNGIVIPGAIGVSYTVESVVATSAGNYSVRVTGPGGSATSLTGTLSLQTAPAVSAQPSNQYKAAGQSVTFSVAATGTGPLSYQWSKDGAPILGANSASYAIAAVSAEHVGRYSVSVSNAVGSVLSQEAELVIVTTPAIVTQPTASNPVSAAGTRLYRARYFGFNHGPDGWSVVPWSGKDFEWPTSGWYWNDQIDEGLDESNLEGAAGGGATVSPLISLVGLTSPELRFRIGTLGAVSIHVSTDKVNWTPLFSIPAGSSFSNDPIAVSLSAFAGRSCYLRFTSTSGTWLDEVEIWGTGLAKEIVELSVYVAGDGLSYQWLKDGVAIAGATSRGYQIPDATLTTTAGNYSVRVSNAAGSVTSAAARVGVVSTITTQPVSQSKAAGQMATFSVVAVGTGPLTYQWYKDGSPIVGATSAVYSIASVGVQHSGAYHVVVTNPLGQVTSASAGLSIVYPPAITEQPNFAFSYGTLTPFPFNVSTLYWIQSTLPDGRYRTITPLISLQGQARPVFHFGHYQIGGRTTLEISTDAVNWSVVWTSLPIDYGWTDRAVGLNAYAGRNVYFRFTHTAGGQIGLNAPRLSDTDTRVDLVVRSDDPFATYQWMRNGVSIAGAVSNVYMIPDVTKSSAAGAYTVRVSNNAGSVTSNVAEVPLN